MLWGWLKELRNVPPPPCLCNKYSYAGCTSLPRALYIKGDKLFQVGGRGWADVAVLCQCCYLL